MNAMYFLSPAKVASLAVTAADIIDPAEWYLLEFLHHRLWRLSDASQGRTMLFQVCATRGAMACANLEHDLGLHERQRTNLVPNKRLIKPSSAVEGRIEILVTSLRLLESE